MMYDTHIYMYIYIHINIYIYGLPIASFRDLYKYIYIHIHACIHIYLDLCAKQDEFIFLIREFEFVLTTGVIYGDWDSSD